MPIELPVALPDALLARLSDFLAAQMGLHFPKERWRDLGRGIAAASRDSGYAEVEAYIHWLLAAPLTRIQIERLASHLTVGETYFLREKGSLDILEQQILPELLRTRAQTEKHLRIWSAGCCTGEEPYSIAMLVDRLIPGLEKWNLTILATDINPRFLRKAAQGIYGAWSFRDTPAWLKDRYFSRRKDGRFEIQPRIRQMVSFSYLNLAEDAYPSLADGTHAMDVIFCRNVLMYFTAERAASVIDGLHRCLLDGGWLITSPAETSSALFPQFVATNFPGAVLYRKAARTRMPRDVERWRWDAPIEAPPQASSSPARLASAEHAIEPPAAARVAQTECETALGRARTCANEGRLAEAVEWCAKAIAADKLNPGHHYLLASIRREQRQIDSAAQSLRHALYLDPGFALAHFALGNLRLQQGRRREAERHFEQAFAQLQTRPRDEIVPESDGLTAGRLCEIIGSRRSSTLPVPERAHDGRLA